MTTYNHNCQDCKHEYKGEECKPLYKHIYIAPKENPGSDIYLCERKNKKRPKGNKRRFKTAGHDIKLQFCIWLNVELTDNQIDKVFKLAGCSRVGTECAQREKVVFEIEYCEKAELLETIKNRKKDILKIIKNNNTHVHYYPKGGDKK